ncbi:MAG: hypothetical protein SF069_09850 [Phycisphaerae bacterium]|nr:hypothetical protein [Phycisphaerae bacterium]
MPLAQDRELDFFASADLIDLPIDLNVRIFKGSYVGRNRTTGFMRPLVAGDDFVGVAYRAADNTVAGATAGGLDARVLQSADIVATVSGVAAGDIGREVYATDDETLSLTGADSSFVGRIVALAGAGQARIRLQTANVVSPAGANLCVRNLADATVTLSLDHVNCVLLMGNTVARTINLPAAASCRPGAWIRVVKTSAAVAAITLDASGTETIDGATTLATIDAIYDTALLLCTGSQWIVLSRDIA